MSEYVNNPVAYAREVVGKDPMARFLGIEVEEVREGYARCSVTVKPEYLTAVERAHGIIIFSVIDQALAVASNSTGRIAVSINITVNFIAGAIDGEKIFAEAVPVNSGKKVSVWRVEVRGTSDKLIAAADALAYHK